MHRRTLLKGLMAVPMCGALSAAIPFSEKTAAGTQPRLRIVLDGPFAAFWQQSSPMTISVFSHMDKPDYLHAFVVNGAHSSETKKKHTITLDAGGLSKPAGQPPSISSDLAPFTWHSDLDSTTTQDDFVAVVLPTPSNIISDSYRVTTIKFKDHHQADMPQGLILEYIVTDPTKPILLKDDLGNVSYTPYSVAGGDLEYGLEVGLTVFSGTEPDPHGYHARDFHNAQLLRFPKIKDDPSKQLDPDEPYSQQRTTRKLPGPFTAAATAVECKIGGFIVTNP